MKLSAEMELLGVLAAAGAEVTVTPLVVEVGALTAMFVLR
jgi:hypothetical protein